MIADDTMVVEEEPLVGLTSSDLEQLLVKLVDLTSSLSLKKFFKAFKQQYYE